MWPRSIAKIGVDTSLGKTLENVYFKGPLSLGFFSRTHPRRAPLPARAARECAGVLPALRRGRGRAPFRRARARRPGDPKRGPAGYLFEN